MKEVVLIPDPKEINVIRSTRKADLMRKGYVVNGVELDKSFSQSEVMETLVGLFSSKFADAAGEILQPPRYLLETNI